MILQYVKHISVLHNNLPDQKYLVIIWQRQRLTTKISFVFKKYAVAWNQWSGIIWSLIYESCGLDIIQWDIYGAEPNEWPLSTVARLFNNLFAQP